MDELPAAEPKNAEPKGVKGWLLFFCISQVFFLPSNTLKHVDWMWNKIGPHPFPVAKQLATIDTIVSVAVALYGMIVGILIWRRHGASRSLVRVYLVVRMLIAFFSCGLLVLWAYNFARTFGRRMAIATIPLASLEIAVAILWWCYFTYSKRVRNTFPPSSAP